MTELIDHLDVIGRLDGAIGPIKQRRRGHTGRHTGGQLLVGVAAAQLAGEDFDRRDRHARRAGRRRRLHPELVAGRDPAADPPGPPRRRRRSGRVAVDRVEAGELVEREGALVGGQGAASAGSRIRAGRPAGPRPAPSRCRPRSGCGGGTSALAAAARSPLVTSAHRWRTPPRGTGRRGQAARRSSRRRRASGSARPAPWSEVRPTLGAAAPGRRGGGPRTSTSVVSPAVNRAWMWGALLAASLTGWLHQLTARPASGGALLGHGARQGQAMIATLRHRLIRVPARLVRHAGALTLRLPPARRGPHPHPRPTHNVLTPAVPAPISYRNPAARGDTSGARAASNPKIETQQDHSAAGRSSACYSRIRV